MRAFFGLQYFFVSCALCQYIPFWCNFACAIIVRSPLLVFTLGILDFSIFSYFKSGFFLLAGTPISHCILFLCEMGKIGGGGGGLPPRRRMVVPYRPPHPQVHFASCGFWKKNHFTIPSLFFSGPLTGSWRETVEPVMCAYKLVSVHFKWFGLQKMVESYTHTVRSFWYSFFQKS